MYQLLCRIQNRISYRSRAHIMPDNDATPCAQPDTPTPRNPLSAHWKVLVLLGMASCITEPDVPEPAALDIVSGNDQI